MVVKSIEGARENINNLIKLLTPLNGAALTIDVETSKNEQFLQLTDSLSLTVKLPLKLTILLEDQTIKIRFYPSPIGSASFLSKTINALSATPTEITFEIPRFPDLSVKVLS